MPSSLTAFSFLVLRFNATLPQNNPLQSRSCLRRYVGSAFGLKYFKNVGFSVAGNPALSISSNSYAGAFAPGAFVGNRSKNRCGAFFVVCH